MIFGDGVMEWYTMCLLVWCLHNLLNCTWYHKFICFSETNRTSNEFQWILISFLVICILHILITYPQNILTVYCRLGIQGTHFARRETFLLWFMGVSSWHMKLPTSERSNSYRRETAKLSSIISQKNTFT